MKKFIKFTADTNTKYSLPVDEIALIGEGSTTVSGQARTVIHYCRGEGTPQSEMTVIVALASFDEIVAKLEKVTEVV